MSNIEKIRQEIERLKKWSESSKKEWIDEGYNQNAFAEDCRIKSFDKLLAFLDSLPEEPNKDLVEAAKEYRRESYRKSVLPNIDGPVNEYCGNIKDAFIAGAKWAEEQQEEEQIEVELGVRKFSSEMVDAIYTLPSERTTNTEENPANWEYEIARHFYKLGFNAGKEDKQ